MQYFDLNSTTFNLDKKTYALRITKEKKRAENTMAEKVEKKNIRRVKLKRRLEGNVTRRKEKVVCYDNNYIQISRYSNWRIL